MFKTIQPSFTILSGHTTPETAYLVEDYPFGFRLRCKIRYWLEYKSSQGYRLVSQTTNPKVSYEHWNKPKASTYAMFGGVMFLDEKNHVHWEGLTGTEELPELEEFMAGYGHTLPEEGQKRLAHLIRVKQAYDQKNSRRERLSNSLYFSEKANRRRGQSADNH